MVEVESTRNLLAVKGNVNYLGVLGSSRVMSFLTSPGCRNLTPLFIYYISPLPLWRGPISSLLRIGSHRQASSARTLLDKRKTTALTGGSDGSGARDVVQETHVPEHGAGQEVARGFRHPVAEHRVQLGDRHLELAAQQEPQERRVMVLAYDHPLCAVVLKVRGGDQLLAHVLTTINIPATIKVDIVYSK